MSDVSVVEVDGLRRCPFCGCGSAPFVVVTVTSRTAWCIATVQCGWEGGCTASVYDGSDDKQRAIDRAVARWQRRAAE